MGRRHTIGEMAGALAHELNQPLHAINNYVHGIQRRLKRNQVRPDLTALGDTMEQVSREVSRAAGIVAHLREFVRGREPRRSSVDIGPLLRQAVELLTPAARDKGVTLMIEAREDLPTVRADAVQLEQVLVNLVANAMDAVSGLPAERRNVLITARSSDRNTIEIIVRDCGRGVPEQLRDKVFEAFVTTKEHGLGLGLPISRSIVASHGGRIWMVDNEPHGAAVHFTLPLPLVTKE
jgi:C4-dicarboxylate-specific signal transduction histidine kinase